MVVAVVLLPRGYTDKGQEADPEDGQKKCGTCSTIYAMRFDRCPNCSEMFKPADKG